jgi:hypothetical protein
MSVVRRKPSLLIGTARFKLHNHAVFAADRLFPEFERGAVSVANNPPCIYFAGTTSLTQLATLFTQPRGPAGPIVAAEVFTDFLSVDLFDAYVSKVISRKTSHGDTLVATHAIEVAPGPHPLFPGESGYKYALVDGRIPPFVPARKRLKQVSHAASEPQPQPQPPPAEPVPHEDPEEPPADKARDEAAQADPIDPDQPAAPCEDPDQPAEEPPADGAEPAEEQPSDEAPPAYSTEASASLARFKAKQALLLAMLDTVADDEEARAAAEKAMGESKAKMRRVLVEKIGTASDVIVGAFQDTLDAFIADVSRA